MRSFCSNGMPRPLSSLVSVVDPPYYLPVSIRNRMVLFRYSRRTRASATPTHLKGPLFDSRLNFVLLFSMIDHEFVYLLFSIII